MAMSSWREGEGNGNGEGESESRREARDQEREEGASSPFYSGPGLPGYCQVTVGRSIPGYCQVTVGWSLDRMLTLHPSQNYFFQNYFLIKNFKKDLFVHFMYMSTLLLSSETPEEGIRPNYKWL